MSATAAIAASDWPLERRAIDVAELLHERIRDGRAAPSTWSSERALAEELGVDRDVVAEALSQLRREGIIALAAPSPEMAVLPDDDGSLLLSAYVLREALDPLAARLAAIGVGPAIEPVLHAAIEQQRRAVERGDRVRSGRAEGRFHCALLEAAGNQFLLFHSGLVRSSSHAAAMRLGPARSMRAVEDHAALMSAVCARDGTEAERVARDHVRATIDALSREG